MILMAQSWLAATGSLQTGALVHRCIVLSTTLNCFARPAWRRAGVSGAGFQGGVANLPDFLPRCRWRRWREGGHAHDLRCTRSPFSQAADVSVCGGLLDEAPAEGESRLTCSLKRWCQCEVHGCVWQPAGGPPLLLQPCVWALACLPGMEGVARTHCLLPPA